MTRLRISEIASARPIQPFVPGSLSVSNLFVSFAICEDLPHGLAEHAYSRGLHIPIFHVRNASLVLIMSGLEYHRSGTNFSALS